MPYQAKIVLDSLAPSGARLTTFELTYPRFVHSEFNTHRMISRNAASSRAIPVAKMIERVREDPAMPCFWGAAQKGMQADVELAGVARATAGREWLAARDEVLARAETLLALGMHKQLVNRILEPWCWITVIASATDWSNFFWLRCHRDAQPEIRKVAALALRAYRQHEPTSYIEGQWHCPLIQPDEAGRLTPEEMCQVSTARCARISYLTHDGKRDIEKDLELFERLKGGSGGVGHWSPFEHVARAESMRARSGNFWGWTQYRKLFPTEHHGELALEEMDTLLAEMTALGVLET